MNKEQIISWLKEHNIQNYFIYNDLTIDVEGDVNITKMSLENIPVQFHVVNGCFDCINNNLTSLKGCPKYIDGNFYCNNNNKLVNLEGGPETVTKTYECDNNLLVTLQGLAQNIGMDFKCSSNRLTKLEYLPKIIKGNLNINKNNLISLQGCSDVVEQNFDCSKNDFISLKHAPKSIGNCFFCYFNNITSVIGFNSKFFRFLHTGNIIPELKDLYEINDKKEHYINIEYGILAPILNFHKLNEDIPNKISAHKGKFKI